MAAPRGWYPDPMGGGGLRWWDGTAWGAPSAAVDTAGDVERKARVAAAALWSAVPAKLLSTVAGGIALRTTFEAFDELVDSIDSDQPPVVLDAQPSGRITALSQLGGIVSLIVAGLFLVWFFAAAKRARAAGIPARRTPGWAIGGWFIPVGNYWLPYQSARDLFREGDPERRVVGRWWALYLLGAHLAVVAQLVVAWSTPVGFAVALTIAIVDAAAVLAATRMMAGAARAAGQGA